MPLSDDPVKRERQLANLRPGAGAGRVGQAPALKHGGRTVAPQRSPDWSPAVELAIRDLEARVDDSLRDGAGALLPWAVPSVEAVAVLRVAVARLDRHVADAETRGKYDPELDRKLADVGEKYHRALEREALTLRSRLEATAQARGLDSARAAAWDHELEERERALEARERALEEREAGDG